MVKLYILVVHVDNNNMEFLYSTFSLPKIAQAIHILSLLTVTSITFSTHWAVYTWLHASGATGILSTCTIAISVILSLSSE